jgi:cephalosporin hydroxylase
MQSTGAAERHMFRKILGKTPDYAMDVSLRSIYLGQFKTTYRGVPAWRCPFDYVVYQMVLSEVRPDLIIEIGTNEGGGAYYLADLLTLTGDGLVHTIDIRNTVHPDVQKHPRIKFYSSGWDGYDLERETAGFRNILIIDDGSHTYEHVLGALEKFSPKVTPDSYFIVEDGIITDLADQRIEDPAKFNGGPLRAIKEFTDANPSFAIEQRWSNMFGKNSTFNVNGYLKRVR